MGKVIALVNQKGGVGKTTTAVNLGASLAACERRTLLVDLDPQANATSGTGLPKSGIDSMYDVLIDGMDMASVLREGGLPMFRVAPSSVDLVGADLELANSEDRFHRLEKAIDSVRDDFDYILIDCPPSLGLLTVNALTAADGVLVPMQCEYYALEGVSQLVQTVEQVKDSLNPELEIDGIVLTMYDDRINLARQVSEEIHNYFGDKVYTTVIPRNVRLGEAPSFGKPVILYDIRSRGSDAYLQLSQELIRRSEDPLP